MMEALCCGANPIQRDAIVSQARQWIGTPYCHQASARGVGADCLGLVRGIWRELCGNEPQEVPVYNSNWADSSKHELLLSAVQRHLISIPQTSASFGDVLIFRIFEKSPAKHMAILVSMSIKPGRIIHAYSSHTVCETSLAQGWSKRLVGAFRFPDWSK